MKKQSKEKNMERKRQIGEREGESLQQVYDFMKILLRLSVSLALTRRLGAMNKLRVKQYLHVFSSSC